MASYDTVGALGLSEEGAGSDKLAMETTAEREGDEWLLNGHKRWVTNLRHADYVLTYAKTGPEADAPRNVTAFLVPAGEFDVETVWDTLGANPVKSPKATLSDVRVPDDQRVGPVGEGYVQRGDLATGLNVPARAVGIARAALDDTVAYTAEREQFDHPIAEFQGSPGRSARWRRTSTRPDCSRSAPPRRPTGEQSPRGRTAWRRCTPPKRPSRTRTPRCSCTAASATRPRSTSSATSGTRGC